MRSINPKVELIAAEFQAPNVECFHLFFTGVGGARVHAKLLCPANAPSPHPAVLLFHGYTGDSGDWFDKLGRGLDDAMRGSPEKMLFRQIFLDTAQLARIVMEMLDVDPNRVDAMGGSQGGGLTIACVALEPRIKRAVSLYPFLSDYIRVWEIDQAKDAYKELQEYFRHSDPTHQRESTIFEKLGYIDIQSLAHRIQAEVLWGIGLMDTICPPSSQFAVYNKLTSPKKMVIYPDFGHEPLPGWNDQAFQFLMRL
jgi:cephalosporin-C deacetylase